MLFINEECKLFKCRRIASPPVSASQWFGPQHTVPKPPHILGLGMNLFCVERPLEVCQWCQASGEPCLLCLEANA
ncbi:hypothetical protein AMECASPLE_011383 [Ameca splendens]|uniref:Uncharacterized protein n=1 Tax=Ameca splendens TaxID=208324 RepID=A0ABV0XDU2_9TELE